jgi:hypothetical protein
MLRVVPERPPASAGCRGAGVHHHAEAATRVAGKRLLEAPDAGPMVNPPSAVTSRMASSSASSQVLAASGRFIPEHPLAQRRRDSAATWPASVGQARGGAPAEGVHSADVHQLTAHSCGPRVIVHKLARPAHHDRRFPIVVVDREILTDSRRSSSREFVEARRRSTRSQPDRRRT